MKKTMTRITSLALAMLMIFSTFAGAVSVSDFSDFPDDWSTEAMTFAVENGLLQGYENNTIAPSKSMTRAEMATVLNRAFKAWKQASINFSDVSANDWFYTEVSKAVAFETFNGTSENKFSPNSSITRAQAFTAIARALKLDAADAAVLNKYSDAADIPVWAEADLAAMVAAGYINGSSNGTLKPNAQLTRAEFAQVMYNIIKVFASSASIESVSGNVMIAENGLAIENVTIDGDLIVGANVTSLSLKNVTIKGRLLVRDQYDLELNIYKSIVEGGLVVYSPNEVTTVSTDTVAALKANLKDYTTTVFKEKSLGVASGGSGGGSTVKMYSITVESVENGTITVPASAKAGETVTVTATPNSDEYKLLKVLVNGKEIDLADMTFKMPAKDVTITAEFSKSVTVEVVQPEEVHGSLDVDLELDEQGKTDIALVGQEITVTAQPEDGYKLVSITVNGEPITGNTFIVPEDGAVIEVVFEPLEENEYSITLGATKNGSLSVDRNAAIEGDVVSVTATPRVGYELVAIKVNGEAISGTTFTMPAKNVVVTAEFAELEEDYYSVNVGAAVNGILSVDKNSAKAGDTVSVTATPNIGYELAAIKVNGKELSGTNFTMPEEDIVITAEFVAVNYQITVEEPANGTLTVDKTQAIYNEVITVTATPDNGYELAAIKVDGLPITGNTFTMPADGVTVTAEFKKIIYSVTVTEPQNGQAVVDKTNATMGDTVTVSTTANEGYELAAIKVNGEAIDGNTFTMPAGEVTIVVEFRAIDYTVNVEQSSNGTLVADVTTANIGDTVTVTATPDEGYELVAIKVNGDVIDGNTFTMPAGEVTIIAEFRAIDYTITVTQPENGSLSVDKTTANIGDTINVSATPDNGYKLDYIMVNGEKLADGTYSFKMPAKNVAVSAAFSKLPPDTYSIVVGPVQNGSVSVQSSAAAGETVTVTATPDDGYQLVAIKVDGDAISGSTFTMPEKTVTVTAEFAAIEYAVTVADPENGSVIVDKTAAVIGETVTVTATPDNGYMLTVIKVNGEAIVGNTFTMPAGDVIVTAEFGKLQLGITVIDPENGSISVDKTTAVFGDTITVTATPDEGYELSAILVNGTAITGDTFTMPAEAVEVTAEFTAIVYKVVVVAPVNGSISVDKTTAVIGETVTVTTNPDTGYVLSVIKVDGKAISGNSFQMKAADAVVTAEFVLDDFTITVEAPVNGSLSVDPTVAHVGEIVTVTATPDDGYKLSAILVNGVAITGNTFTMPAEDVTVSAEFELLPPGEYSIIIGTIENGTVTADKTSAAEGTEVTVTTAPAKYYQLVEILVNGVAIVGDTFTMPAEHVVITATFEPIPYAIRIDFPDTDYAFVLDTEYEIDDNVFELAEKILFNAYGGKNQKGGLIKQSFDRAMSKINEKGYLIDGRIPKVEIEDVRTYEVNVKLNVNADTDIDAATLTGDLAEVLQPDVYDTLSLEEQADVLLEMEAEVKARMKDMSAEEKRDWLLERLPHYADDSFTTLLLNRLPDDVLNDAFNTAIDEIEDNAFSLKHEVGSTHYIIHLEYALDVNAFVDNYFTSLLEEEIIADCREGMKMMSADEKREWLISKIPTKVSDKAPDKAMNAAEKALNKIPDADLNQLFNDGVDLVPDESFTIEHIPGDTHYTITMLWDCDPIIFADAYYQNVYIKNRVLDKLAEFDITPTAEEWALYSMMLPSNFVKDMGDYHQILTVADYYQDAHEILDAAEAAFRSRDYSVYYEKVNKAINKGIPKALAKAREKGIIIVDDKGNDITAEQCIAAAKALYNNPDISVNELLDIFGSDYVKVTGSARGYTLNIMVSRIDLSKI